MRNKILVTITMMALLLVTGCSAMVAEQPVTEVSVDQVLAKIESKETFAFIIGSKTCPACEQYRENLKTLKEKENVSMDYIDLDAVNPEDRDKVVDLVVNHLDGDVENGLSTPTTYFIDKGKLNGEPVVGSVPKEEIVEVYKKAIVPVKQDNKVTPKEK